MDRDRDIHSEFSRVVTGAEDRKLPVALTEEERDTYALQLASEVAALSELDTRRKIEAKEMKDKRDAQEGIVLDITRKVNTMTDERLVRCSVHHDYRAKKVEVVRDDTGMVIESRSMSRAELEHGLQLEL